MLQIRQTISRISRRLTQKHPQHYVERRLIHRWVSPTLHELYKRRQQIGPEPLQPRSTFLEWNYDAELYAFGGRLNESFKRDLLKRALRNRSFVVNNAENQGESDDNGEFVREGDEILANFIRNEYRKYYPDVIVEALYEYLTSTEMLSHIAKHIGLTDIIKTAEFPVVNQTLADTFKAVLAALKLSTNQQRTELFVKDFVLSQLNGKEIYDIWTPDRPFEYLLDLLEKQQFNVDRIDVRLCQQSAINTILANYQVGVYDREQKKLLGIGWGESIEIARNTAALNAIQRIHDGTLKFN